MKELNNHEEQLIEDFAFALAMIDGPCDMFPDICPPDLGGVREPRRPVLPIVPSAEHLVLAAVYDMSEARKNRRPLLTKEGAAILGLTFA